MREELEAANVSNFTTVVTLQREYLKNQKLRIAEELEEIEEYLSEIDSDEEESLDEEEEDIFHRSKVAVDCSKCGETKYLQGRNEDYLCNQCTSEMNELDFKD